MKVIEDRIEELTMQSLKEATEANYPLRHQCFHCKAILEVEAKDVKMTNPLNPYVTCQVCSNPTVISFRAIKTRRYTRVMLKWVFVIIGILIVAGVIVFFKSI